MPLRSCSVADAKLFRNYRKAGYPLLGWQCCELFTKSLRSNYEVAKLFQWRCDAAAKPLRTRCKTVAMLARKPRSRFRSCSDDAAKLLRTCCEAFRAALLRSLRSRCEAVVKLLWSRSRCETISCCCEAARFKPLLFCTYL